MGNTYKMWPFHKNKISVNPRGYFFKPKSYKLAKLLGNLVKIINFMDVLLIIHISS